MPLVIASTTDSLEQVESAANPPPVEPAPSGEGETPPGDSPAPAEGDASPGASVAPAEESDDGEEADEGDGATAPKPGSRAQRRITTLLSERTKLRLQLEQKEQENATLLRLYHDRQQAPASQEQGPPAQADPDARPQRVHYTTDEAYQEAVLDWRVQQQVTVQLAQREVQSQQAKAAETVQTQKQRWDARYAQGAHEYDDWDTVVNNPAIRVAEPVQYAIFEAVSDPDNEAGHALLYYLGQHPDEVAKLNALSPSGAARRIGTLQAQLQGGLAQPERTAPVVPTPGAPRRPAPPAPVTPVSGSSPGSATVDLERMSPAEFIAYRNKTSRVH